MELKACRDEINEIDEKILKLFVRRMEVSAQIAAYKKEHGLPVYDALREQEKLDRVKTLLPDQMQRYGINLCESLMDLSKEYQQHFLTEDEGL